MEIKSPVRPKKFETKEAAPPKEVIQNTPDLASSSAEVFQLEKL